MAPPRPARPRIPEREEYGEDDEAQLAWETVRGWLEGARYFWVATTGREGHPHAVPVWAVWLEDRLFFATSPETWTARNLKRNSQAVAHPESAADAVMVHGVAGRPSRRSLEAAVDAYEAKYAWRLDPDDPGMPFFELAPRRVVAWRARDVRGSGGRWDFS